jgi:hypothetical protein
MKKYQVTASSITYYTLEIEAESQEDAFLIAKAADGGDFEPDGFGDWEICDVAEVTQ